MSQIKTMPAAKFLVDSGLLFEINRTILHPLGLALSVAVEEDGAMRVGDLWDYRDDPEGMAYEEYTFSDGQAKHTKFMADFGTAKLEERLKTLGYVVQERADQ